MLVELLDRRLGVPELVSKRGLRGAILRGLLLPLKLLQSELLQQLLALAEHLSQLVAPSGVDVSPGFRTAAMATRPCTPAEGRRRASRRQHTQCETLGRAALCRRPRTPSHAPMRAEDCNAAHSC